MFMRFRGGAVGHKSTLKATLILEAQNDTTDVGDLDTIEAHTELSEQDDEEKVDGDSNGGDDDEHDVVGEEGDDVDDFLGAEDGEEEGYDEEYGGFAEY